MKFRDWLNIEEGYNTGAKLGLYAPISDALGQYPPLYGISRASDLITYIYLHYGKDGLDSKDGFVYYHNEDPRVKNVQKRS